MKILNGKEVKTFSVKLTKMKYKTYKYIQKWK